MPLTFAGICPHNPFLIEELNPEKHAEISKLSQSLNELELLLHHTFSDVVILISPYAPQSDEAVVVYTHSKYIDGYQKYFGNLQDLSNFSYERMYNTAPDIIAKIYNSLPEEMPIILNTMEKLDSASLVALDTLMQHKPEQPVIVIAPPKDYDLSKIYGYGQTLGTILTAEQKRIAVVAIGQLSHTLSEQAPGGFHEDGARFDHKLRTMLNTTGDLSLNDFDQELRDNAKETILAPLSLMLGMTHAYDSKYTEVNYHKYFGVGHLIGYFDIR
jgi:aromatic ring-opening dioxygenase LigB subunit